MSNLSGRGAGVLENTAKSNAAVAAQQFFIPRRMRAGIQIVASLLMTVGACSDKETTGPDQPQESQVASVAVTPSPVDLVVGQSHQLAATARDSRGVTINRPVEWRSADTTVASVSASGMVHAKKAGEVQIVASSGGKEGSTTVRIGAASAAQIEMSTAAVAVGDIMWGPNPELKTLPVLGKDGEVDGLGVDVTYAQPELQGWLDASLTRQSTPAALKLQARTGILTPGEYTATVRVFSARPGIATRTVQIKFTISPAPGVLWISSADRHNCALTGKGEVFCWGYNNLKQLGAGTNATHLTTPTLLADGRPFGILNAGELHNCAVAPGQFPGGKAFCWGSGFMGNGVNKIGASPTEVPTIQFVQVAPGYRHTCALTRTGEAYCWGMNNAGQVGDGTKTDRLTPVRVTGGQTFTALTAGREHTCGLTQVGDVFCWGSGAYAALGTGGTADAVIPARVTGGRTFAAIDAGELHTCGILTTGEAYCWGYNLYAQLGDGSQSNKLAPTLVVGGLRFQSISAGGSHTCAITTAAQAYCWGYRNSGRLGDGNTVGYALAPVQVAGNKSFRVITTGYSHTCAITPSPNEVYCWGFNEYGALGDGTGTDRSTPVRVQIQ